MTPRERRKMLLARRLHIAEVEMAVSVSQIERCSRNLGRPLKAGRTEPGIPVRARVERFRLEMLQRATGRTASDIVEIGIQLLHAHLSSDAAAIAELTALLTPNARAC